MSNTENVGNITGRHNMVVIEFPVANGVTVNEGDFVKFASGRVTNASITGAKLVGRSQTTATGDSGGSVSARIECDPSTKFLIDNDETGGAAVIGDVGSYYDLTGAAGAQVIDTSTKSATTGQFVLIEVNPQVAPYSDDTSYGLYVIAESAFKL